MLHRPSRTPAAGRDPARTAIAGSATSTAPTPKPISSVPEIITRSPGFVIALARRTAPPAPRPRGVAGAVLNQIVPQTEIAPDSSTAAAGEPSAITAPTS